MRTYQWILLSACAAAFGSALTIGAEVQPAHAFPFLKSWHTPASGETNNKQNRAGAGGLYGTGGPSEYGIQCAHCHIGGEGKIGLDVVESPAFGQQGNDKVYAPGQLYSITVNLTGEHLNVGPTNNLNGFAMSFEDASGNIKGGLISDSPNNSSANCPPNAPNNPPNGTTYVYGDCHGILFVPNLGATTWSFQWQAPAAGGGEVTMWYGAVDGDTGGENSTDDDVIQGNQVLLEGP